MNSVDMNNGQARLYNGDSRDVLRELADNSIDSIVTDPPYALVSIQKRFGKPGSAPAQHGTDGAFARASAGFMGQSWDVGDTAFAETFWADCLRVLKPGGHVVAFGGTRTYHRLVCAIEDAGFEIRDQIGWLYGSGFPKSHDVSKGIDKRKDWSLVERLSEEIKRARETAGLSLKEIGEAALAATGGQYGTWYHRGGHMFFETGRSLPSRPEWDQLRHVLPISEEFLSVYDEAEREITGTHDVWTDRANYAITSKDGMRRDKPASEMAIKWQGWGTALKPSQEPICLARKPLIGTVAENVLEYGTGALNIDGSRLPGGNEHDIGRWPANIIHDGSDEVLAAFPTAPGQQGIATGDEPSAATRNVYGAMKRTASGEPRIELDKSAARFFYCAKASRADRNEGLSHMPKQSGGMVSETSGQHITRRDADYKPQPRANIHPTVKPTTLMQYLCRLITPPGGVVLDPFMGSGSTGKAAVLEGFRFVGIEREEEYFPIAEGRIQWALDEVKRPARKRKAKKPVAPANDNPPIADLFGSTADAA